MQFHQIKTVLCMIRFVFKVDLVLIGTSGFAVIWIQKWILVLTKERKFLSPNSHVTPYCAM